MKAIVQHTYGPPSALALADVEIPRVGPHDVLVQVHATTVTQGDRRLRSGDFPGITWLPGRLVMGLTGPRHPIPGTMFAGTVTAVGAGVTRFAVGDDVFGSAMHGAYAEYLAIAETGPIAAMPADLDHAEAAALPYGATTALVFLRDRAAVRPGERVCIVGASGGVGRFAVQIARHLGAEVTAVCSAPTHALVTSLGAARVVDHRTQDFRDFGPYDVVFDTIGAARFERPTLTPTGRYLSLVVTARLLVQGLVTALVGGRRAMAGVAVPTQRDLEAVAALAAAGVVRPVMDRAFPLDRVADAHDLVDRVHGSVTITVAAHDAGALRIVG